MKSYYQLNVVSVGWRRKQILAIARRHGLHHLTPLAAYEAATAISKDPDVEQVTCKFIQEKPEGVWRKGRHFSG